MKTDLRVSMAGSGNPYTVLTPSRRHALHCGLPIPEEELQPLLQAELIRPQDGRYVPAFFVANVDEFQRVTVHAASMGQHLAARLKTDWPTVAFRESLFLVGAQILDIGLLNALARDASLMPPAPTRPDGRYYLWMVECPENQSGPYGQWGMSLPDDWWLLTFGAYSTNGIPNEPRNAFHARAQELCESAPESLAGVLDIPVYDQADVTLWNRLAQTCAEHLTAVYYAQESDLRALYNSLSASAYAPHGFSEFFCWYDHVAYSAAIDILVAEGLIHMPADRFSAALWHGWPLGQYY